MNRLPLMAPVLRFATLLATLLAAPIGTAGAASETFDGATIQPPPGWSRSESKSFVAFEKITGASYGQIAFFRARPATGVSAEMEFEAEWADLVTKTMDSPTPKKRTSATRGDGTVIVTGRSKKTNQAGTTAYLHVFVEGGRVSSVRSSTNDPDTFLAEIDAFVAGIRFSGAPAAPATASVAVANSGDPNVSADPARVPGRWKNNVSAVNLALVYWDPSYSRALYDLKADGTYTFVREIWQTTTPDDFWFVEESGSWKLEGGVLLISPKKSIRHVKTREGKVKKTEALPLEVVRYQWHFRYFAGIQETSLVLKPPKQTDRDGVFGTSLEPDSYLYSADK